MEGAASMTGPGNADHDDGRYDDDLPNDEVCDCCGEPWDQCRNFFENWICGMMADGTCSLAGTEECDWECPRNG
jgi:hypothetical protein